MQELPAGPDAVLRLDSLRLEQEGPDRVLVSGAEGEAPPPQLKVSCTSLGGFRNELTFVLTGLDIDDKVASRVTIGGEDRGAVAELGGVHDLNGFLLRISRFGKTDDGASF